ncbi:MAG: FtsQ-type POTRA domain-containing protein [bacterium]
MKWNIFKNKPTPQQGRAPANGRRVTGVQTGVEIPPKFKFALIIFSVILSTLLLCHGGWSAFNYYYFGSSKLFELRNLRHTITVNTGKTLTPEVIYGVLGLKEGENVFELPIEQKRKELMERTANIRDISIVRRMPNKLIITIIEREPIARVGISGTEGRVVDEEGVVFNRNAGIGALPFIKGADNIAGLKPGDRLHGMAMSAVRLVINAQRPEVRLRLLELDTVREDYLMLTFSDHRQAKFAWDGMDDDEKDTMAKMQAHFDELGTFMESEAGRICLMWDARVQGRIAATLPGVE